MTLTEAFNKDMLDGAKRCKAELGYNPTYWTRMVIDHGGVGAAKRLLQGRATTEGFATLWEKGRLDLTVEYFVLLPRYAALFTEAERAEARHRLELHGFVDFPAGSDEDADVLEPLGTGASAEGTPPLVPPTAKRVAFPSHEDLEAARAAFGTREPRDLFYRAATDLVELAFRGKASITVGEAVAVLLQTWNRQYYQFRPAGAEHFDALDALVARHETWLSETRLRKIASFGPSDENDVREVFEQFEGVVGPVGAAKALHLLAPEFLPLWDRKIATIYGFEPGPAGTNGSRYLRFMHIVKEQAAHVERSGAFTGNVLKAIDEYNYCRYTKGWI